MKVLLIGATGTFGSRLARLVAGHVDLTLAARGETRLAALAAEIDTPTLLFDRTQPLAAQITQDFDVVVDASGPFQTLDISMVDWALSTQTPYLDFSDSPDFVLTVLARDAEAKAAGIALISGLSTYPAVSGAALATLADGRAVFSFEAGIAPGPRVDIGRGVMAAIAAQAGEHTVPIRRRGRPSRVAGLTPWTKRERRIAVPGEPPLADLAFLAVEAPDPVLQDIPDMWCGAAIRPQWRQTALALVAALRSVRLFPSLKLFAGLMQRVQGWARLPARDRRGGMYVRGAGPDWKASWHLCAPGDVGPNIPAIPAAFVLRAIAKGRDLPPGARAGDQPFGDPLTLADLALLFAELGIAHGLRRPASDLYPRAMGDRFDRLAPAVQALHRVGSKSVWQGRADIQRGRNPLARMVADLLDFPEPAQDVPVTVTLSNRRHREHWQRDFGGHIMRSTQELQDDIIVERFGPIAVRLLPKEREGRMHLETLGWSVFGLPLPHVLAPGGTIYEQERDGRFHFHVDITAPLLGRLVFYEGWLESNSSTH